MNPAKDNDASNKFPIERRPRHSSSYIKNLKEGLLMRPGDPCRKDDPDGRRVPVRSLLIKFIKTRSRLLGNFFLDRLDKLFQHLLNLVGFHEAAQKIEHLLRI